MVEFEDDDILLTIAPVQNISKVTAQGGPNSPSKVKTEYIQDIMKTFRLPESNYSLDLAFLNCNLDPHKSNIFLLGWACDMGTNRDGGRIGQELAPSIYTISIIQ